MNNDDVRLRLHAERDRLVGVRAAASHLHVGTDEPDTGAPDALPAERATETIERELDESVAQHAEDELVEVESALERLLAGNYGTCEVCAQPIPKERLEFLPATRYCVDDAAKLSRSR